MALVDKFDSSKVCRTERESEKMTQSAFFSGKDLNVSVILAMAWCNAKVSALKLSQWVPHASESSWQVLSLYSILAPHPAL